MAYFDLILIRAFYAYKLVFVGSNVLREAPLEKFKAVSIVREYHQWVVNEGFPSLNETSFEDASPGFSINKFKWNPPYQGATTVQFDNFYDEIKNQGITLFPVTLGTVPQLAECYLPNQPFDYVSLFLNQKPVPIDPCNPQPLIYSSNLIDDPAAYHAHADYFYHFTVRYGFSETQEPNIIAAKLHKMKRLKR